MLDIDFIKNNIDIVKKSMKRRNCDFDFIKFLEIDVECRKHTYQAQSKRAEKNKIADKIGLLKRNIGDENEILRLIKQGDEIGEEIKIADELSEHYQLEMRKILEVMPNILDNSVPFGGDEDCNIFRYDFIKRPDFSFVPKKHFELFDEKLMDFDSAIRVSGSRFVILKGHLALLERALKNFMLDIHTKEFGYSEMSVPYLVNKESVYGVGHLPNFKDDMFVTENGFYLISTSEVALTNIVRDCMLREEETPLRFVAFSSCFRSEAGSAGKDTRGIIRQHQFQKVELVSIVMPEKSDEEHERMLLCAEEILKRLELHYRVMTLCSGDTGFASKKTYDIEVWLPGEQKYREISSCSNMGDFQARRMKTRAKRSDGKKDLVHTLNGSGLAIGRTIVAILENYQQEDGSIKMPKALLPYMNGVDLLRNP